MMIHRIKIKFICPPIYWIELSFILTYHLHKQAIKMLCKFLKSQWVHNILILMAR